MTRCAEKGTQREPSVRELLTDPVVQAVMQADAVSVEDLLAMLGRVQSGDHFGSDRSLRGLCRTGASSGPASDISVAPASHGPAVVGVILTGQLNDGTSGLLAVKDRGGTTIVQDPSEATARSMPLSAMRHMKIDHVCTLKDIAGLFIKLAADDPAPAESRNITELMEVENHIAEGIFNVEDWWQLEQLSEPSGLNCPTCRSALYELKDKRVLRFRCRSGHAFSAESLLSGQSEAREFHLSSLFGALIEEVTLAKRMRVTPEFKEEREIADGLGARVGRLERQAVEVCDWLKETVGLVEPEPE